MTTTRRTVDILIQSPEGEPIAIVELKNIQNLTRGEAVQLRESFIHYGLAFQSPFFLLLSQDVGFLWKNVGKESHGSLPALTFPMENVIARFSNRQPGERLYKAEFEILVLRWLNNLTLNVQNIEEEPESTLALTGFIEAIKGADVLLEAEL